MDTTKNELKDVISLIRFSTAEQTSVGRAGVAGQRDVNELAARRHGLRIVKEVVVIDVSGRHVRDDPQFQDLFRDLKKPNIAGIVVNEQSRLFRPDGWDDYAVLTPFKENRKLIYTPSEVIDPNNDAGETILTINGLMSGQELKRIRARTQRGLRTMRLEGKASGGSHTLPKTVRYVREMRADGVRTGVAHWELIPEIAAKARYAFDLLLEGHYSFDTIATMVQGPWQDGTAMRRFLINPINVGIRRYAQLYDGPEYRPIPTAKNPKPKPKRKKRLREVPLDVPTREEIESGAKPPIVPPIVTWAEWDRAQAIMQEKSNHPRKRKFFEPRFLAQEVGFCSCGNRLYAQHGRYDHREWDYYRCQSQRPKRQNERGPFPGCGARMLRRDALDAAIGTLVAKLCTGDFLEAATRSIMDQAGKAPDPGAAIRQDAAKRLEAGRTNLRKLVRQGLITAEEYKADLKELEDELKQHLSQAPAAMPQIDPKTVARQVAEIFTGFTFLNFDDKRTLLRGACKEIIVDFSKKELVKVTLNGGYLGGGSTGPMPRSGPYIHSGRRRWASQSIDVSRDIPLLLPQPIQIVNVGGVS